MTARAALLAEIVVMALETLRSNKLRSGLTILSVVIGVTSIVAMTALIRGFGDQLHELIQQIGSDTVYVQKAGFASFTSGSGFVELMRRPDLTEADVEAIRKAPSTGTVTYHLAQGGPGGGLQRFTYRNRSTRPIPLLGADANWLQVNFLTMGAGRFFSDFEVQRRRQVVVLGGAPAATLFPDVDSIGKKIRIGREEYTVVGVLADRPSLLGSNSNEIALIPATTYDKEYRAIRVGGYLVRFLTITAVPREGVNRSRLMEEVEQVMRSRHRLKLDEENDFEIGTADSVIRIFNQLTQAVVLALVVISSIALAVGGIGVMAIMTISVTERTREIGLRKSIGATRRGILWQFLIEAVVLTSVGGLIGIVLGAGIGLLVNHLADFPVSLPLWSFVLGIGFSALVGIFFGLYPAMRASRLDPIEALRHE